MYINELKEKPVWQMTGEELLQLLQTVSIKDFKELSTSQETQQSTKRYVYGILSMAYLLLLQLFLQKEV